MKLELGRRADYAVRAAVDLARCFPDEALRKAHDIAKEMHIPLSYVTAILAELVRAELVLSRAGRNGGYRLARAPETIDLLAVMRAVDGDMLSTTCVLRNGPCRWDESCAVHVPWARAQLALLDELANTTLAQIVTFDEAFIAGTFEMPDDVQFSR